MRVQAYVRDIYLGTIRSYTVIPENMIDVVFPPTSSSVKVFSSLCVLFVAKRFWQDQYIYIFLGTRVLFVRRQACSCSWQGRHVVFEVYGSNNDPSPLQIP